MYSHFSFSNEFKEQRKKKGIGSIFQTKSDPQAFLKGRFFAALVLAKAEWVSENFFVLGRAEKMGF